MARTKRREASESGDRERGWQEREQLEIASVGVHVIARVCACVRVHIRRVEI